MEMKREKSAFDDEQVDAGADIDDMPNNLASYSA